MKPRIIITILMGLLLFWSCTSKPGVIQVSKEDQAGDKLFLQAEKLFKKESYENALEAYEKYLDRFPQGHMAPAAVMRIGKIYVALGNYKEARNTYNRIQAEFPDSTFAMDAKVEILVTYLEEGEFDEVIQKASSILEESVSSIHLTQTYAILGDTYLAMDAAEDAVYFYTMAFKLAVGPEKKIVIDKLNGAISSLESTDILSLLGYVNEEPLRGYLMYQLGLNYSEEKKYDEALRTFSEFINNYPEHENIPQAEILIEEISKKLVYRRTTIGCLLPLSGPYEAYGSRALKGIELAFSQFNSQGIDPPVSLIVKNTGADPEKAAAAVQDLIDEKVAAIIGPMVKAETAATLAQLNGIPIITVTQKDNITEIGDYVFRNFLTPKMQVETIVSYAAEELGLRTFAILYPEEKYGTTFMNLFWDEVIAHGGEVVGLESYNPSHTDFADPIKKLVGLYYEVPEDLKESLMPPVDNEDQYDEETLDEEAKTDEQEEEEPQAIVDFEAVFIPDEPNKAGLIIPQLAFYDVEDVYLLGTNLWHSDKLIEMAKEYVQEALLADGFYSESKSKRVRNFVRIFEETYGAKPGFIEATTYDSAVILFQLVSRPDIRSRNALKNELLNLRDFPGVTGLTSFDPSGDVQKQLSLFRIKGSRFVELESN
jgi:ABC-type branched-subunit amino acid transport system substrate-binding protein/predicted negative regulator of RcsB-dependent stress response